MCNKDKHFNFNVQKTIFKPIFLRTSAMPKERSLCTIILMSH